MAAPMKRLSGKLLQPIKLRHLIAPAQSEIRPVSLQGLPFSTCIPNCQVVVENYGSVQMISIDRQDKRNAVDPATAKELFSAFKQFDADKDMTVAVLYGKGGMFCSGMDLSTLANAQEKDDYVEWCDAEQRGPMSPTRYMCSKPVIAAVEGYAVAGGMELALWCDMRIMDESAIMGIFCRRFGVPLIDGGTLRLPKLIGLSRALDLILTGREIRAKEALEWGLVHRVCETGSAVGRAVNLAMEISKFPQQCMLADRASAYHGAFDSTNTEQALRTEWNRGRKVIETEAIHGARRFMSGIGKHGSFNLHKVQKKDEPDGES